MSFSETANQGERLQQRLGQAWQLLEKSPVQAGNMAREVEHLARTLGNNRAWADGLFIWSVSSLCAADAPEAITLASRALAVYRFLGHTQGQWSCLTLIALAWNYLGDTAQAAESQRQADFTLGNTTFQQKTDWLKWFK
jgi:hypothetical protein